MHHHQQHVGTAQLKLYKAATSPTSETGNGPPTQRRTQAHAGPCKPWRQRSAIPLPTGARSTGRTSRQVEHQQVQYKRADDTPGQPAALRPIHSALQYQHNRSHMDLQRRVILTNITLPIALVVIVRHSFSPQKCKTHLTANGSQKVVQR